MWCNKKDDLFGEKTFKEGAVLIETRVVALRLEEMHLLSNPKHPFCDGNHSNKYEE